MSNEEHIRRLYGIFFVHSITIYMLEFCIICLAIGNLVEHWREILNLFIGIYGVKL